MDLGNTITYIGNGISRVPYRPNIKINKLHDDAHLPTYGSKNAACADLYAYIGFDDATLVDDDATLVDKDGNRCIMIQPHETVKIHTGLRMAPPEGWYVAIYARSGLATKSGLAPANKIGICDQDYRGEYIVALHNHSDAVQMITHGDRIAQMAVVPFWQADFEEVSKLDETERGNGGFGSTGTIMKKQFYSIDLNGNSYFIYVINDNGTSKLKYYDKSSTTIGYCDALRDMGYEQKYTTKYDRSNDELAKAIRHLGEAGVEYFNASFKFDNAKFDLAEAKSYVNEILESIG